LYIYVVFHVRLYSQQINSLVQLYVFYVKAVLQLYIEKVEGESIKRKKSYHIKLHTAN